MLTKDCLSGEIKPEGILIYLWKGKTYFFICLLSRENRGGCNFQDYLLMNSEGTAYWYSRDSIRSLFRQVI